MKMASIKTESGNTKRNKMLMLKIIFAIIIKICKTEGLQWYSLGSIEENLIFLSIIKAIMTSATIIKGRNTGFITVFCSWTNRR